MDTATYVSATDAVHRSWWNVDADFGAGAELLYAEDGVCVMPTMTMRGRDEIAAGYAARQANGPRLSRHLVSNLVVDDETGHITARYVLSLFAVNGLAPQAADSPQAICDVVDTFVEDGSWLVQHRELTTIFVSPTTDSVMLQKS